MWVCDQFINHVIVIRIEFSISLKADQKWGFEQIKSRDHFEEKLWWIKSESTCICFTWLTSFKYFTGSKVGHPRICFLKNVNFRFTSGKISAEFLSYFWAITFIVAVIGTLEHFGSLLPAHSVGVRAISALNIDNFWAQSTNYDEWIIIFYS